MTRKALIPVLFLLTFATTVSALLPEQPVVSSTIVSTCASHMMMNFETPPINSTPFKTYWYLFNDAGYKGKTIFTTGADKLYGTEKFSIKFSDSSGLNDSGSGIIFSATFGPPINIGTCTESGLAGAGFDTYDSVNSTFFNTIKGTKGTIDFRFSIIGFGFDFCTLGDVVDICLEILDQNDVETALFPHRGSLRGKGNVFHQHLEPTKGKWVTRFVCFSHLETDSGCNTLPAIPLDIYNLAEVRFRISGPEGKNGTLKIDNIRTAGCNDCSTSEVLPAPRKLSSPQKLFSIKNRSFLINRDCLPQSPLLTLTLFNLGGKLIASIPITSRASVIPSPMLPSGTSLLVLTSGSGTNQTVLHREMISVSR